MTLDEPYFMQNKEWYYFDETGAMKTGWVKVNNTWFYMNEKG